MIRTFNPDGMAAPASNYSQGASVPAGARWLHISGQVGASADGTVRDGFEAQLEQCFDNLIDVLKADGMDVSDLVKITVFAVPHGPECVAAYREIRDRYMGSHKPAATFLGSVSLASDGLLVEVEAVAAKA
ncbi:RidA family protein [Pseudahrensia aquimaris]|uniref:RidA family protein n=1 Tax=Pseudahrensia aquimaris TaxID=744461 RepID=A0ABW3FB23_9HYPH